MESWKDLKRFGFIRVVMSSPGNVEEMMEVLACPKCNGDVKLNKKENKIVCHDCRLRFSVEDGIPNMLLDDAESF